MSPRTTERLIELLLFLHILLFVFSFAFTAGIGILLDRVARSRDAKTIQTAFSAARPLSTTGGIGWLFLLTLMTARPG